MPLYLDQIWLDHAHLREALQAFSALAHGASGYPPGVRVVAGPWFSNEEAKIVLVLDIADHAETFPAFASGLLAGVLTRRRLEPIVEWSAVDALVGPG